MPFVSKVEREYLRTLVQTDDGVVRVVDQLIKIKSNAGKVLWGVSRVAVIDNHADPSICIFRKKGEALEHILDNRAISFSD